MQLEEEVNLSNYEYLQKFTLDESDLRNMQQVVEEFKIRHATITNSIENTYLIGNKLLDYIEK